MKKTLLLLSALLSVTFAGAQVLVTENAEALTVGDIGTDMTGATPGQGGWRTTVTAGNNSDFQVVNVGGNNVIQITGSNTSTNTRRMYKDVSTLWAARDTGNNVAQVQYNFFTGAATTSTNSMRVVLYDPTGLNFIAGLTYNLATRELRGLGYYNNGTQTGNFSFTLAQTGTTFTPLILAANTWYTLGFSFNKTTGELIFKEATGLITVQPIMGASTGIDLGTLNITAPAISATGQVNTVAGVGLFDNIDLRALPASAPLLAVETPVMATEFSVYPNPADNVLQISSQNSAIKGISIVDLNGRTVNQQAFDLSTEVEMNVSGLSKGMYILNVDSDQGSSTHKFLKH
ncbi:MAG TPA: T9SS type A sorting domain-containing protein [Flavobacterium sp.]|jgi:hypothetical protein